MVAWVLAIDAFWRSFTSTMISVRSEVGKNCCSTNCMPQTDAPNRAKVIATVIHLNRIAVRRSPRKARRTGPACAAWCAIRLGSSATPSTGANSTATTQLTTSDTAITTNSEKVNSPAADEFRPIGMNPATVTSVPVSIGAAIEVQA